MLLSEIARLKGIAPFNDDDFKFVGEKVSIEYDRLILVGGQAIEVWGHYFNIVAPSGNHEPLTEDIDWYGGKKDAIWLCSLLGGRKTTELQIAKDFDPSMNSALAYVQRPDGRILLMDFLRGLIGLSNEEITKFAVTIVASGVKLSVLHPLYCLQSRLANLETLSSKRNTNGVMQAEWAIDIAEAYVLSLHDHESKNREMIKACTQISELAEFKAGPYCYTNFKIDPLRAVSERVLNTIGGRFVTEDWPRKLERIRAKRAKKLLYSSRLISYSFNLPQPPVRQ